MPEGWISEQETVEDESGALITHFEASCKAGDSVDIYVGPLPEDTTARDQAMSNYADMVGFDDDDPEDFNPIAKLKFNGKNAFGFDGLGYSSWRHYISCTRFERFCVHARPFMFISG